MRRFLVSAGFLGAYTLSVGCSSGFEPGTTDTAESALAIQATCLVPGGDPMARYPWNASFPLNAQPQQHVFCQHHVTETSPSSWPTGFHACPLYSTPGNYQVDFWTRDSGSNPTYRCARVDVPHPGGSVTWHIAYTEVMMLGWLSNSAAYQTRWLASVELGPGTSIILSALQDVNATGCIGTGNCVSGTAFLSDSAKWVQLDNVLTTSSITMGPTAF